MLTLLEESPALCIRDTGIADLLIPVKRFPGNSPLMLQPAKAMGIQFERGETSVLTGTTSSADFYVLLCEPHNHGALYVKGSKRPIRARGRRLTMSYRKTEWSGKIEGHADY